MAFYRRGHTSITQSNDNDVDSTGTRVCNAIGPTSSSCVDHNDRDTDADNQSEYL